eukprot:CAMPEP_0118996678 /NCGR_PEP_ID=MMETSP1173-20130426/60508_1 /TAXON_ID=1034831 /ORGANISM="Rhizochromulina marina cf, Strain CCMP1243" /LENGTH=68 /DNA_ID=CAMNT_0006948085 /DNA_START=25 /DNA_END=228 /DNA_ORIENTATION=-
MTTVRPMANNVQVHDSYGAKCNSRFLLNYGFAMEDNTAPNGSNPNTVPIVAMLLPEHEAFEEKRDIWI